MANINDANFVNRKIDEGDRRGFPNTTGWNSTVGKKLTAFLAAVSAFMWLTSAATQLFPELPRRERPRFSEDDRRNPRR